MIITEEVSQSKYAETIREPYFIFGRSDFNNLNKIRAEKLHFLLFKDSKYRAGIIGGEKEGVFLSPFSAPFGGFVPLSDDLRISTLEEVISSFLDWAQKANLESVKIILPPTFYFESYISKISNIFYRLGFSITNLDLNYHYHLSDFDDNYIYKIKKNARKNLKNALTYNFTFFKCTDNNEKFRAYETIRKNREARGFPLRMTWEQIEKTINIITADFFILSHEGEDIASAVVFHVAENVVQVIYWGDLPDYTHLRTMNFLSFKVFEYYKNSNIQIVDIGPSTENSMPNHGLCEFKESIGCSITSKYSFSKEFK